MNPSGNHIFARLGAVAATLACAGLLATAPRAEAAGLLIADGGFGGVLEIESHDVDVTIRDNIAITRVTQVFRNTESRIVEALYTFPVPKGASVANFSMWINGREMVGEVLEKKRAREIYDSYKQTRRDPGLLEQVDYKTFEMRIFPIAAGAEQRVEITYVQELNVDHDWATYVYPLATVTREGIDSQVQGTMALRMDVQSVIPIAALESPSHADDFVMADHSPTYHTASLEQDGGSLARDVVLAYQLKRPKTGIDLVTSKEASEDGYFSILVSVGEDLKEFDTGMDYIFVLDISGSMANDGKLPLSRGSVGAFLESLGPEDRFELLTFNVKPNQLFGDLREANEASRATATAHLESRQARGGTSLGPALRTAYQYGEPDRPLNVVILSDGLTEQEERAALTRLIGQRPSNARVFCIGVGNEVNRPLLEQIADDTGGLAAFISRGDDFTRQAAAFRRKLMRPAVSDLRVRVEGIEVYDLEPAVLPNLYHGTPVRLYGRYRGRGEGSVRFEGAINGAVFSQAMDLTFPAVDNGHPEIERMWAWKRIDRLLKDGDRSGNRDAISGEVIRLGELYSIMSEYTSFIVLENDQEYRRWKIERRNARRLDRDRAALAVAQKEMRAIRDRAVAGLGPNPGTPETVKTAQAPNAPARPGQRTATPDVRAPARPGQSLDFNLGTGPVGPLFLGIAGLLEAVRRRRNAQQAEA